MLIIIHHFDCSSPLSQLLRLFVLFLLAMNNKRVKKWLSLHCILLNYWCFVLLVIIKEPNPCVFPFSYFAFLCWLQISVQNISFIRSNSFLHFHLLINWHQAQTFGSKNSFRVRKHIKNSFKLLQWLSREAFQNTKVGNFIEIFTNDDAEFYHFSFEQRKNYNPNDNK